MNDFEVAVLGGGLAGLTLSIDLAMQGRKVILLEKGKYPRHKVCGEYISMESHRYLLHVCPGLAALELPVVKNFKLTAPGKSFYNTPLDLGGFGISRYLLEEMLFKRAKECGVNVLPETKVNEITEAGKSTFVIHTATDKFTAKIVCNSTGRKSNFEAKAKSKIDSGLNYVGVKYHVKMVREPQQIEIHNFPGGYCGISDIEDGLSCLCYLVNSEYLVRSRNSIPEMEKKFLYRNENLKMIFETAEFLSKTPVTISGINFNIKKAVNDNVIYLGDSAGCISPVTGNGMSMALRSAFVLAKELNNFFEGSSGIEDVRNNYKKFWNNEFSGRIKFSRYLQKLSEYPLLTKGIISLFKFLPALADRTIKLTHGKPF